MSALTSTMVLAGCISAKYSPCTRLASSHRLMSVTKNPSTDDLFQAVAKLCERIGDTPNHFTGLLADVFATNGTTIKERDGRACHCSPVPDSHCARVAGYGSPRCTRRDTRLIVHWVSIAAKIPVSRRVSSNPVPWRAESSTFGS